MSIAAAALGEALWLFSLPDTRLVPTNIPEDQVTDA